MRAYYFGNMYLSSIQQGIQALHATTEMYERYRGVPGAVEQSLQLNEWATDHKTVVLLNAGYSEELHDLCRFFDNKGNGFPWSWFTEGEDALDGALTCVGVVLPRRIYDTAAALRKRVVLAAGEVGLRTMIEDDGEVTFFVENAYGINCGPDNRVTWRFNKWEYQLMDRMNQYGLAR